MCFELLRLHIILRACKLRYNTVEITKQVCRARTSHKTFPGFSRRILRVYYNNTRVRCELSDVRCFEYPWKTRGDTRTETNATKYNDLLFLFPINFNSMPVANGRDKIP